MESQSPGLGRRTWRALRNFTAVVGTVFLVVFGGTKIGPVNEAVCRWEAFGGNETLQNLCERENLPIDEKRAADFIDEFNRSLFGTHRSAKAAGVLTRKTSGVEIDEAFVAEWDPVVLARRTGSVASSEGFNVFTAEITRFKYPDAWMAKGDPAFSESPKLELDRVRVTFAMSWTDRGLLSADPPTLSDRDPLGETRQAVLEPTTRTDDFDQPVRSDDGELNFLVGQQRHAVCQVDTGRSPDRWWSVTYLGWTPHADLEGGDTPRLDLPNCPSIAP